MTKNPIFWMFILMGCINAYQHFLLGIVLVVIPLLIYLFKRTPYSRRATAVLLFLTIAAMLATVQSLVDPLFR